MVLEEAVEVQKTKKKMRIPAAWKKGGAGKGGLGTGVVAVRAREMNGIKFISGLVPW